MYLINEVSRKVDLSQKRIREYEKEGFIKPLREPKTNNRLYSDFDIAQIRRITHLIHERGFTLACLRNLLALAPCWNVFDCRQRRRCAAYQRPHDACWQIRQEKETLCPGPCEHCALYLNREQPRRGVLEPVGNQPLPTEEP
ncbi:MAG: helix-turn-helix domain-containing protein [Thermodesulfobacteriota bacterium]